MRGRANAKRERGRTTRMLLESNLCSLGFPGPRLSQIGQTSHLMVPFSRSVDQIEQCTDGVGCSPVCGVDCNLRLDLLRPALACFSGLAHFPCTALHRSIPSLPIAPVSSRTRISARQAWSCESVRGSRAKSSADRGPNRHVTFSPSISASPPHA